MNFFKNIFGNWDAELTATESSISFIGEQKGEIETKIKHDWKATLVKYPEISEAYLVLASFNNEDKPHPVLGLFPQQRFSKTIAESLGKDFKRHFGNSQFIDIIFLTDSLRSACSEVCPKFYPSEE